MLSNVIANAYLIPSRNIQIPSTPGRKVRFYGGQAKLTDPRDVAILLRRPDITMEFSAEWAERLPEYVGMAGQVKANVVLPQTELQPVLAAEPDETVIAANQEWAVQNAAPKRGRGRPRKTEVVEKQAQSDGDSWIDALYEDEPY